VGLRAFVFTFEGDLPKFRNQTAILSTERSRRVETINPQTAAKIQPELMSGETIHWAGAPNTSVIFHSDDWATIPFTLIWTGFFVFWEAEALGFWGKASRNGTPDTFMALWGIPFLVVGNYMVWGRFVVDAWLKRRTYYAVTSRRILVLQHGWKKKTSMTFLDSIPTIEREGTEVGTLWFGPKYPVIAAKGRRTRDLSRFSVGDTPVFADIENVESVYHLVLELREKTGRTSTSAPSVFSY
jgi:hypothetical protein